MLCRKVSRGLRMLALVVRSASVSVGGSAFARTLGTMHAMRSNPSIERTPYGMLRMPSVAAHVER